MANALARASLRVNRGPHPRLRRALVIAFCLAIAAVLAVGVRAALDPAPASSDVAASLAGRPLTAVHPAGAGFHDGFGLSAASALNSLAIGAPLRDRCEGCADEGAVFVAERIGERWRLSQLLAGVAPGGRFGEAIAYRVGGLVIGAPGEGGGVVYIYESSPDGFRLPQRFDPALPAGSRFGAAISATDEYLVVAAPGDDRAGPDAGAVLLYRQSGARDEWLLDDVLTVDSGESAFGRAVAAGNQWLAVSAAADPRDPASTGAVYVYGSIDGRWELQARLVGSDTAPGDDFGTGLAMSGDRIVVGSPRAGEGARERGAVFVFDHDGVGWVQTARLAAPARDAVHAFGQSVAVRSFQVVASARWGECSHQGCGSEWGLVYVLEAETNLPGAEYDVAALSASKASTSDRFGAALAVSSNVIVVGAPGPTAAPEGGAAYLVPRTPGPAVRFVLDLPDSEAAPGPPPPPTPTATAGRCDSEVPGLEAGVTATVADGTYLRTTPSRDEADLLANVLLQLKADAVPSGDSEQALSVELLSGPTCEDAHVWWRVRSHYHALEGWIAERTAGEQLLMP